MTAQGHYPQAGSWSDFVKPVVEELSLIATTGLSASYSPDNAHALADLIRTMADRIDNPLIETMTVDQLLAGEFPTGFLNQGDIEQ